MKTIEVALGKAIRDLRRAKKFKSQEKFADACGLHRTFMSLTELGKTSITVGTLDQIADALDMKPSDILKEAERNR